jgi:hypothetical protein
VRSMGGTGGGWESMAKVVCCDCRSGVCCAACNWRRISRKRHTEATPPSHVPEELLAMRRGIVEGR